ncbi:MAG: hypothetical protein A2341_03785 [Deltaproteobacteria bacterium RIFOXYB12_FULL_58_9]|nr:MAG: hypothetical protein A2341_03785 [Deltaproteobacteria bacterium RIFOXYB12_FULL_58_9]
MTRSYGYDFSDGARDARIALVGDIPIGRDAWATAGAADTVIGHLECQSSIGKAGGKPRRTTTVHTSWYKAFKDLNDKVKKRFGEGFVIRNDEPSVENDFLRMARRGGSLWPSAVTDMARSRIGYANGLEPDTETVVRAGPSCIDWFDLHSGTRTGTLSTQTGVHWMALSPDHRWLLYGHDFGIFDLEAGTSAERLFHVAAACFDRTGNTVVFYDNREVVVCKTADLLDRVVDETWRCHYPTEGSTVSVALSPNGRRVARATM